MIRIRAIPPGKNFNNAPPAIRALIAGGALLKFFPGGIALILIITLGFGIPLIILGIGAIKGKAGQTLDSRANLLQVGPGILFSYAFPLFPTYANPVKRVRNATMTDWEPPVSLTGMWGCSAAELAARSRTAPGATHVRRSQQRQAGRPNNA